MNYEKKKILRELLKDDENKSENNNDDELHECFDLEEECEEALKKMNLNSGEENEKTEIEIIAEEKIDSTEIYGEMNKINAISCLNELKVYVMSC